MFIQTETTPNPQTLKFLPGRQLLPGGSREFATATEGAASPLARALFRLDGVTRVFFGQDFVTVSKDDDHDWAHLKAPILAAIMDHFTGGGASWWMAHHPPTPVIAGRQSRLSKSTVRAVAAPGAATQRPACMVHRD